MSDKSNVAMDYCSKVTNNPKMTKSPEKSDILIVAPKYCSKVTSTPQTSDISNVTQNYCSNVSIQSGLSNVTNENCSKTVPTLQSDIVNLAPTCRSKLSQLSDSTNITIESCSASACHPTKSKKSVSTNVTNESCSSSTKACLNQNEKRNSNNVTGAIPKLAKNGSRSVEVSQPRILNYKSDNLINIDAEKVTSSQGSSRWGYCASSVNRNIGIFEAKYSQKTKSPSYKVSPKYRGCNIVEKLKSSKVKLSQKSPGKSPKIVPNEVVDRTGLLNPKKLKSGSMFSVINLTNKSDLMTPVVNTGKVSSIVQNFESNFNVIPPKLPPNSAPEAKFSDRGEVQTVKDAFEVLMSRKWGDTPKKTPGKKQKRLNRDKGSPALSDIRNWVKKKPGGSVPPIHR